MPQGWADHAYFYASLKKTIPRDRIKNSKFPKLRGATMGYFTAIKNKILEFENRKDKKAEIITLFVFAAALVIISTFHEPWFDEAQSWMIARDASYADMFFTLPHYEGHPPLWWLILSVPAKAGVPYEIGLKTVGIVISIASAALLLFKTKLPRLARICIPFTYFFFYQYGVIVRPYCLMLFAFILLSVVFEDKDEHPWKMVLCLMLICCTSAYGIVIAGGVSVAWCLDILKGKTSILKDRRFFPLLSLALFAACLIVLILPYGDTYSQTAEPAEPRGVYLIVTIFTFLGENLVISSPWFRFAPQLLQEATISLGYLIPVILLNLILWIIVICYSSKRNLKYLLIPYLFFTVFSTFVYFNSHHMGITGMILLFWLCVNTRSSEKWECGNAILKHLQNREKIKNVFLKCARLACCASLVIPIFWTMVSAAKEIYYPYDEKREIAEFLKENNLENLSVATEWRDYKNKTGEDRWESMNTSVNGLPALLAYFDENFVYNFNNGDPDKGYTLHRATSSAENKNTVNLWAKHEAPDILIGEPDVNLLTGGKATLDDYSPVCYAETHVIWKGRNYNNGGMFVYARNEIVEEYGLKIIEKE